MSVPNTEHSANVVLAKFAVPELPLSYIARPYLIERFMKSLSWKVILIEAPVGYGKTTLLSEWSHTLHKSEAGIESAWLSLDSEDDGTERFWKYLLTSLSLIWPDIVDICLFPDFEFSREDERSSATKEFHIAISNFLYEKTKREHGQYLLFLDNIDCLSSAFLSEVLDFFTTYLPSNVHVVAAGSFFPTNTPSHRHWDSVHEFPPSDLAFSRQELLTFMAAKFGDAASESLVNELYELTRGWATGIRLFADLFEAPNLRNMARIDREVLYELVDRYYTACVFKKIPDDLALFLVQSSVCEAINADCCDCLTERDDSHAIIAELAAHSFFIESCPFEKGWYHYHPLFLHWLRSKLFQMNPIQVRELCVRAQAWFEHHAYPNEAAKFMLMACDADLIENLTASALFDREQKQGTFVSWLCSIPASQFPLDPRLSLYATWGYLCCGRADDTLSWLAVFQENLDRKKQSSSDNRERDWEAASLVIEHIKIKCDELKGSYRESITAYQRLLETQPAMNLSLRVLVVHAIAESYERTGEFSQALEYYLQTEAVASLARSPFFVAFSRYATCWILTFKGELKQAEEGCRRALDDCPLDFTLYGALQAMLAYIQIQKNELGEAEANIGKAMKRLSLNRNADMLFEANIVKASYLESIGELDEAYRLIVQTVLQLEQAHIPRAVLSFAYTIQARIAFLRGNTSDAADIYKRLLAIIDPDDLYYVLKAKQIEARIFSSQGDFASALSIVTDLLGGATPAGLNAIVIETRLFQASILDQTGNKSGALSVLNKALGLAGRQQSVRPFIHEGGRIRSLLHEVVNIRKTDSFTQGFTRTVLRAFESHGAPGFRSKKTDYTDTAFTKRENEVLDLLNAGMARLEIAETLGISHNTVKTHLNNIYSKLGVNNRSDAFRITIASEEAQQPTIVHHYHP